ncbi:hypothetical protein BSKO_04382 [Bryopsis sp. KO-2023]|nr:hypothetical protein BSKO_04382 [Bryopsis sp. KO-2023]
MVSGEEYVVQARFMWQLSMGQRRDTLKTLRQAGMCLISQCQEVAPDYSLQFEFRCAHAAPASGNLPAFRLILFVENEPSTKTLNYTSILVDCRERFWTVEHVSGNRTKEIYKVPDRELRPGVFHILRLELRKGNTMSIFCGERSPINNLKLAKEVKATGPMGLAVSKSRLDFRHLKSNLPARPMPGKTVAPYTADDCHLVEIIEKDVIDREGGVTFKDIASLEDAKRLLDEAVTLPLIIPEFFTGIREPWKGVLLFGPPGTGKTLLAKALANMHDIKFFNCSSSMLMSKWRGESEKLVRVLFGMARHYAPSIVFFDEADALISARGGDGEHEASRRFKSELLQQMDGVTSVNEPGKSVMVLATSNCPWDLDEAMRRRFEKRIYIPLPDEEARSQMLTINLKDLNCGPDVEHNILSKRLAGYSGADIRLVCRDASLMPMRRLISNKTPQEIIDLRNRGHLEVKLTMEDFEKALAKIQPSVSQKDVRNFDKWNKEFASV